MISNWKNKDANMIKAQEQVEYMDTHFQKETQTTIERSTVYNGPFEEIDWTDIKEKPIPRIQVLNMNTTDAILHIRSVVGDNNETVKICALNFASFHNPGGKFIEGSNAQEESLCHASNLYNVLKAYNAYYKENAQLSNRHLYKDRAIYSPDIVFHNADKQIFAEADVLTCAAPNWSAAQKIGVSAIENELVFAQRLQFIKSIAEFETVDILILGAWGCGVFKQEPYQVAKICDFIFSHSTIKNIVYAVPGEINAKNYKAFVDCIHQTV